VISPTLSATHHSGDLNVLEVDRFDKNIVQQTSCAPLFPDAQMQLKMELFFLFVRPCMHRNYGGSSESHAFKDYVWPIILDAELYATCPGERVLPGFSGKPPSL